MQAQVIILGAGPAGSSTAYFLAQEGVDVLLCDKAQFPREKICGDGVTSAGLRLLSRMGLLYDIERSSYRAFEGTRVFTPNGKCLHLDHSGKDASNFPRYGYTIRRFELDEMLKNRATAAGARFLAGFDATESYLDSDRGVEIKGQNGGKSLRLNADLLVVATGAHNRIVRSLDPAQTRRHQTGVAMRGYVQVKSQLDPFIELHLDGNLLPGYGWLFPINDKIANVGVGLLQPGQKIRQALETFVTGNSGMREQLSDATWLSPPKSFPLHMDFLSQRTFADRVLVVGEAAGLVDPLTGEGIALALQSGELAADVGGKALALGDLTAARLSEYDQILKERYSQYFAFASRLRRQLGDPEVVNLIASLIHRVKDLQANWRNPRQGLQQGTALLRFLCTALPKLKQSPYWACRALSSRYKSE